MHQKCIRNLSQIQPSLPRFQSLKYYKTQKQAYICLTWNFPLNFHTMRKLSECYSEIFQNY